MHGTANVEDRGTAWYRRLACAVIRNELANLDAPFVVGEGKHWDHRDCAGAKAWFRSDKANHPLDFCFMMDFLGWSVDAMRKYVAEILRQREEKRATIGTPDCTMKHRRMTEAQKYWLDYSEYYPSLLDCKQYLRNPPQWVVDAQREAEEIYREHWLSRNEYAEVNISKEEFMLAGVA